MLSLIFSLILTVSFAFAETPVITKHFMTLVNDHRRSKGLAKLVHDEGLADIVNEHSDNMAIGLVPFGHPGFSLRCTSAMDELGGGNWCGENVAMGQKTALAVFTSWMNSPGHRANIESARASHTGLGYAKDKFGNYYWTQIFIQLHVWMK
ncbi:MAG TPA: CAP domain-containing protein [Bacteriovoracaceae bacterium]|nr:CAP domain-containing protein [Bacteriovoracaceae bacterium]